MKTTRGILKFIQEQESIREVRHYAQQDAAAMRRIFHYIDPKLGEPMPGPAGQAFGIDLAMSDTPPMKVEFTLPTFRGKDLKEIRPKTEVAISANSCHAVTITVSGKEYIVSHKQFIKVSRFISEEFC